MSASRDGASAQIVLAIYAGFPAAVDAMRVERFSIPKVGGHGLTEQEDSMSHTPRISPLEPDERDAQADELIKMVGDLANLNIFPTMLRHPRLYKRWVPYGAALLRGSLPARDRELLILRTAFRCGCTYEWGHHMAIAGAGILSDDELSRIGQDGIAEWSEFDGTLLRAVDELHDQQHLSDATWSTLATRYDTPQLIEVPMIVGHYHMNAFMLNSLGVELEDEYRTEAGSNPAGVRPS